jgi:hypothetical protein
LLSTVALVLGLAGVACLMLALASKPSGCDQGATSTSYVLLAAGGALIAIGIASRVFVRRLADENVPRLVGCAVIGAVSICVAAIPSAIVLVLLQTQASC